MQETECPQCGEWLGVPPEFAERPVRCGACGRVIAPDERTRSAPPTPPRTAGPRFPDREDESYHRPPRKGRSGCVVGLLVVFGLLGCCACGGVGLILIAANPKWESFKPDNGAFTADFPGKPEYSTNSAGIQWPDGTPDTLHKYDAVKLGNTEWFAVHYYDVPKSRAATSDKVFITVMIEGYKNAAPGGFTQISSNDAPDTLYPAKDVEGKFTDPKAGELHAYGRALVAGDRVYLLIAVGKEKKKLTPEKDRFFNSFKPAERQGKPADKK